jgi:hypothetical protein
MSVPKIKDTQVVELIGRNRLGSEILRDGLDVAVPARDRGIDLIAYSDLLSNVKKFVARPIQMKASSEASFSIDRKYKRVANLIIAYVWHVHDPNATVTYALTYEEALTIARKCWGRAKGNSASWKRGPLLHKQAEPTTAHFTGAVQDSRREMVGESDWHSLQTQIRAESISSTSQFGQPRIRRPRRGAGQTPEQE